MEPNSIDTNTSLPSSSDQTRAEDKRDSQKRASPLVVCIALVGRLSSLFIGRAKANTIEAANKACDSGFGVIDCKPTGYPVPYQWLFTLRSRSRFYHGLAKKVMRHIGKSPITVRFGSFYPNGDKA